MKHAIFLTLALTAQAASAQEEMVCKYRPSPPQDSSPAGAQVPASAAPALAPSAICKEQPAPSQVAAPVAAPKPKKQRRRGAKKALSELRRMHAELQSKEPEAVETKGSASEKAESAPEPSQPYENPESKGRVEPPAAVERQPEPEPYENIDGKGFRR